MLPRIDLFELYIFTPKPNVEGDSDWLCGYGRFYILYNRLRIGYVGHAFKRLDIFNFPWLY